MPLNFGHEYALVGLAAVNHLLVGCIGSGKTTFAGQLERRTSAIRSSYDEWRIRRYGRRPRQSSAQNISNRLRRCGGSTRNNRWAGNVTSLSKLDTGSENHAIVCESVQA
ncbi:MAG: AAA family ATPase [Woeseiaceae bacterium]